MFSGLSKHHNHESSHKECAVRLLVELTRCKVVQFDVFIAFVRQQAAKLTDILVHLGQVARTEVLIEWLVHEFL